MASKYLDILTIARRLVDTFGSPLIAAYVRRCAGVQLGQGAQYNGLPIILVRDGGQLRIGDNFCANSSKISNPVGLPHPVIMTVVGQAARLEIGRNVGISGASINCRESITIGNDVMIGGGACIWDNDFHSLDADVRRATPSGGIRTRPVVIEDDVFIGARAIILKGVTIGKGAIVGAGAVVTKSVPAGAVAFGNPATIRGRSETRPAGNNS